MKRIFVLALLLSPLAACGGGGSSSSTPAALSPGSQAAGGGHATATLTLSIPNPPAASSSGARRAQFIGASVAGIALTFYMHSDTSHTTPVGSGTFNVSAASGLCTPATGVRSCTLAQTTQTGTEDLVVASYDAPPVAGSFAAAHQLGSGTIYNVTLTAAATNTLMVAIGGIVSRIAVSPSTTQTAPNVASNYPLTFTAYDAASEAIVAGANTVTNGAGNTETDTYYNTITFAVSEQGGSGHTTLSLNGGAHATSVTVTSSSDTVMVYYDGLATTGYSAAVAGTATGATSGYSALALLGPGIYVASDGSDTVLAFTALPSSCAVATPCTLNEAPIQTISQPQPEAIALDENGLVYVANYYPSNVIDVFAASGNATPIESISLGSSIYPEFITVDSSGRIYVSAANAGVVNVYAPVSNSCTPATPCTIAGTQYLASISETYPWSVATDSSQRLYLVDRYLGNAYVYETIPPACTVAAPCAWGNAERVATFTGTFNNFSVDTLNRPYLVASTGSSLSVYPPVSTGCIPTAPCTETATLATLTGTYGGLAVDASGNIYNSTSQTISVYPPVSNSCSVVSPCTGAATAFTTIAGSNTTLSNSLPGIAVP